MLRNRSEPSPGAHSAVEPAPAFGGAAPRGLLARLRGVCGQGKAPAGAGAFGSAFEVLQDVRQVCGVVAAEFLEEVDLDVHWGFLSLFPPCCTSILSTATPRCQALRVCPSPHFQAPYATVTYREVTLRGRNSNLRLRSRNLPGSNLPGSNFRQRNLPGGNLHLRSSNLRLRR